MKTYQTLIAACLALTLFPGPQARAEEYEFYRVRSGESVEMIAASRGLRPDLLRTMNPSLEHVVFPEAGTVIFVPPQAAPATPPRRQLSARSSRHSAPRIEAPKPAETRLASAAPAPKYSPRAHRGSGLSDAEIQLIWDKVVKPRTGAVALAEPRDLPVSTSFMITSDGQRIAVPSAPPRKPKVEPKVDLDDVQLSPRGEKVVRLLKSCFKYMGVPYVWGGEDPSGMDCSGFIQYVYGHEHGIPMPRTADVQFEVGAGVPRGQEQPGDLVFFETYCPGPSHVGVYLGRNQFIHASSGAGYITIGDLRDEYFANRYLGAKRNW